MTLSITIADLRAARACDLDDRIAALSAHLGRTPEDDEPVPIAVWAEVTPDVADLLWSLRCCWQRGGRAVGVEVACRAADRAMVHARPKNMPVLRAAVDAARVEAKLLHGVLTITCPKPPQSQPHKVRVQSG